LNDDEDCDDGNIISGDGCSSACVVEDGYECELPGPCTLIPVESYIEIESRIY